MADKRETDRRQRANLRRAQDLVYNRRGVMPGWFEQYVVWIAKALDDAERRGEARARREAAEWT